VGTLIWSFLLLLPLAIVTTAGLLLWRRGRSAAAAMIALGFAATLLSLAFCLCMTYRTHAVLLDMTSAPPPDPDTFFMVTHYLPPWALGILGIWSAALGTLWHVRQTR
jgi:hypothetical protein